VVEVDPSRWGVWGIIVVLVLDPAVDTVVDSAVVDNVDEVDTGVDVLDMELDEDATEVDIVDIRDVGDSTVDIGVVDPCVVVSTLVGGIELDPAVVDGVVEGAVVDGVIGGVVDGGRPQMQMPHSALVVESVVEVERRDVVEVDPCRWEVWGNIVVLVLDPAVEVEEPLVEGPLEDVPDVVAGEADVDDKVGVDNMVEDEVAGVEDEVGEEDEAVVEPVSK